ncbi:MAG: hypothetical protein HYT71_00845 [Candidatus Aenigmarchaeota archaeon]|nr:hypothetical protein [Candidatus Aenigmarchaeota archaeon]
MNKLLLAKFLDKGIMVSPSIAGELTEDDYEKTVSGSIPALLDETTLQNIRVKSDLIVIPSKIVKTEIEAKDFLEYYKNKIRVLGEVIIRGLEEKPVSINKMRPGQRNVTLGIVREPGQDMFYLEDLTGRCEVRTNSHNIKEDDVLAVSGVFSGKSVLAEEIIYPELPIKRDITRTTSQASFYFGASSDAQKEEINEIAKRGDAQIFLSNKDDARKITIMILHDGAATSRDVSGPAKIFSSIHGVRFKLQFLPVQSAGNIEESARFFSKRRYAVSGAILPAFSEDLNFIDDDTDFVFFGDSGSTQFTNHKGRSFVSVSSGFVEADLNTRNIKSWHLNRAGR